MGAHKVGYEHSQHEARMPDPGDRHRPLLHRFERYCSTCGLTVGHWAGCPDDASKWTGEDRHHALHGSWIGAH